MANELQERGVYDPDQEGQRAYHPPNLDPLDNQPAGDPSDPRGFSDRNQLQDAEDNSLYNPDDSQSVYDPGKIQGLEQFSDPDSLYNAGSKAQRGGKPREFFDKHKYKLIPGASIFGGGIAAIIIAFFSLLPLKVEHMMQNLHDRFFAAPGNALQEMQRNLFKNYVVEHVIPDYKNCGTTISRKCKVRIVNPGTNPVLNLYKTWADNRIENKLADLGIEVEYNPHAHRWHLKTGGGGDVDIGSNGERIDEVFSSKKDFNIAARRAIDEAMENATKWRRVWTRLQFGGLEHRKLGIRRCIVFCGTRNNLNRPIKEAKLTAKLYLSERVIKPYSETTFIAVQCVLTNCDPTDTRVTQCEDGSDCIPPDPTSENDDEQREKLLSLAERYGVSDFDELLRAHKELSERGFQNYFIEKMLQKFGASEVASKKVTTAIPVIGWIDLAANLVSAANDAGPKLKKLHYITYAAAAVATYMMYQTYADEIHTGQVEATQVGSMVDSLGPGIEDSNDPLVGGTAGAEEAPLYDEFMTGGQGSSIALLNAFLPQSAVAATQDASAGSSNYKCNDGSSPQKGEVCKEERLGQGQGTANAIHDYLNLPSNKPVVIIAGVWNGTIGVVFDGLSSIVGWVTDPAVGALQTALDAQCGTVLGVPVPDVIIGYCPARDLVKENAPKIITGVTNWLLPNPLGTNMGGGRLFTVNAVGANIGGIDACNQIGCQKVNPSVVATIIDQQQEEAHSNFLQQPLSARIFNTDTPYSLVSRLAMSTPLDLQSSAKSGFANIIGNPFSVLVASFGTVFSSQHTLAVNAVNPDPFGAGTVAFPSDKIPKNPDKYWGDHNCGDMSSNGPIAKWQQAAADGPVDEKTGMPVHNDVEPCLLIKLATGASGGIFDSSLLTDEDKAEIGSDPSSMSNSGGSSGSLPQGDAKKLASDLKAYVDNGKVKCTTSGCPDIIKTASGESIKNASCYVSALDPTLLGMLLKLAQDGHTFILSAMCTDHPSNPKSLHHQGKAADFNTIDGVFMGPNDTDWTDPKIAAGKKLDQDIASFMPKSTGFGQVQCHPTFDFLADFNTFEDTCHHQHVQVGN